MIHFVEISHFNILSLICPIPMTKCFKQLVLSPLFLPFYFNPFQFILILLMFLYNCKDGVEPQF